MITVMPRCLGTCMLCTPADSRTALAGGTPADHHWSRFKGPNDLGVLRKCHADDGAQSTATPNSLADAPPAGRHRPSALQGPPLPGDRVKLLIGAVGQRVLGLDDDGDDGQRNHRQRKPRCRRPTCRLHGTQAHGTKSVARRVNGVEHKVWQWPRRKAVNQTSNLVIQALRSAECT